jgi:hypothetical protein
MAFDTDRDAGRPPERPSAPLTGQVVRIKNALLTEMDASESLLAEVDANRRLSRITDPMPLPFDGSGGLLPF